MTGFPLFPERASTLAGEVDALYLYLVVVSVFFSLGIAFTLIVFAIRFRRRSETEWPGEIEGSMTLELTWTIIPFLLTVVMFVWGAQIVFHMNRPPDNAIADNGLGKRRTWKLPHANGPRETNQSRGPPSSA